MLFRSVTKTASSARATGTQTMPPMVEASQGGNPPGVQLAELMDGFLMDADEMQVFASFCTDSGASDKMNELTKIQEELTSRREGAPDAAGGSSAAGPRISISRRNAQEAMLEGMRRLDKEFSNREASVAKAAEDAKRLIE